MAHPRNPYDFVPFEAQAPCQAAPPDLGRPAGWTGAIRFRLRVLTPLFIHQSPGMPPGPQTPPPFAFANLAGAPAVPATSLKGMLRAVHEVATNSCALIYDPPLEPPASHRPCADPRQLCPTCRLFGMVGQGETSSETGAYAGRVFLPDLPFPDAALQPLRFPRMRGGPKPEHWAFYRTAPGGPALGRKRYFHQQNYEEVIDVYLASPREGVILQGPPQYRVAGRGQQAVTLRALPAPNSLIGTLQFVGLDDDELAALLYTLTLEPGQAHRLGFGKAYGLGSVRFEVEKLLLEQAAPSGGRTVPQRFLSYGPPGATRRDEVGTLADRVGRARQAWRDRGSSAQQSYEAFAALVAWERRDYFLYPEQHWFRGGHSQTPLAAYQRGDA